MKYARLASGSDSSKIVFAQLTDDRSAVLLSDAPWCDGKPIGELNWREAQLRAPVIPSKILCVGRNYAAHAKELGNDLPAEPLLFMKPPSAILDPNRTIILPSESNRVEHEAELAVVIGKRCRNISPDESNEYLFGYTCCGDITARDLQRKDGQWTRAKGFDTFCPVGPWIETELDLAKTRVQCRVNGVTRQDGPVSDMTFSIPELVAYASRIMTLEPGDLIVTGTPAGVGPLVSGDKLEIEVSGIGVLVSNVSAA